MRNAFIEELVTLAEANDHIALIVGDLGYSVIEPFADRFPDRFVNAGVAEQNMTGLAAGMASEGYHVFTYSIANFPTFRCAEQIRNDVDHHRLPVTVVAVGGGVAYGALGYSHHAVQDYALMRAMPNMVIAAPGDPLETRACLRWLVANPCPSYLRLGKAGEPRFHESVPDIMPGRWVSVHPGDGDAIMLSTGAALGAAIARADGRAVWLQFVLRDAHVRSVDLAAQCEEALCLFDQPCVVDACTGHGTAAESGNERGQRGPIRQGLARHREELARPAGRLWSTFLSGEYN